MTMNLTAQVKLLPDASQVQLLLTTLTRFNDACNYVSIIAFRKKVYRALALDYLQIGETKLYHHMRAKFPELSSTHIQFIFRKVADAYKPRLAHKRKTGKSLKRPCKFKPLSSIPYNHHGCNIDALINLRGDKKLIKSLSISASDGYTHGRIKLDYIVPYHSKRLFASMPDLIRACESRLVYKRGKFYLYIPVEQGVNNTIKPDDSIGADLGVVNIATTSRGKIYTGSVIEAKRVKFQKHRSSLQKCGSKSAKRRLKKVSGKEARFRKDINHCISKELVSEAEGTKSRIVLEDLTNIRDQTTVSRQQRARHHGWSFFQLREFITYKSILRGVEVKIVDPHYTSQRCSICGHIHKKNRRNQFRFVCRECGYDAHADYNAACNLAWMGNVGIEQLEKPVDGQLVSDDYVGAVVINQPYVGVLSEQR